MRRSKRTVTDHEFQTALDSIDNQNIIHSVCGRFTGRLSPDELKQCGLDGLWYALQSHDPTYRRKFTTSLHQFVEWECQNAMTAKYGDNIPAESLQRNMITIENSPLEAIETADEVEAYLSHLKPKHAAMLKDRYMYGFTLRELADKYGYTPQGIQYLVEKSLNRLRGLEIGV